MKTPLQQLKDLVNKTDLDMIPKSMIQNALPKLLEMERQIILETFRQGRKEENLNGYCKGKTAKEYYEEVFK